MASMASSRHPKGSANNLSATANGAIDSSKNDPFLSNDFYPLSQAHYQILSALRADEASTDADLYRRIASSNSSRNSGSNTTGTHLYRYLNQDEPVNNNNSDGRNNIDSSQYSNGGQFMGDGPAKDSLALTKTEDIYHTLMHTNSIPLPPYLTSRIKETKITSLMGILPEANMVWVSVDHTLYLWEYDSADGMKRKKDDFVHFKVPSGQCIVSVGIVKPKIGIFKDVVEWALVVTTQEEAILCALAREATTTMTSSDISSHNSLLRLIPTRYVIPTDSVPILAICGSDDGRIFMGGYDGSLYEMLYEGIVSQSSNSHQSDFNFDDDDNAFCESPSMVSTLASGSKRAFSSFVFGPTGMEKSRPRKCRKVNHTAVAPPLVSAIVPGFVLRAASAVFGSGPRADGGPITNLTLDKDRNTLYALTVNGYIHAFDLGTSPNTTLSQPGPPRLACSINVTKSVKRFLDCVAHGKMYPPHSSGMDSSVASITFPGGGAGAQAGVGGMEGARAILKVTDMEEKEKTRNSSYFGRSNASGRLRQKRYGYLHPTSVHIVPPSESKCLTLVVLSSSGLRYYLSVLPNAGTSPRSTSMKPGNCFTLCHVRAPPPFSIGKNDEVVLNSHGKLGVPPSISEHYRKNTKAITTSSIYASGVSVLAINCCSSSSDQGGDSMITITPDYSDREQGKNDQHTPMKYGIPQPVHHLTSTTTAGGGLSETASLPLSEGSHANTAVAMPGGHVWDIAESSLRMDGGTDLVWNLFFQSKTPTDGQLTDNLVPAYFPPSRNTSNFMKSKQDGSPLYANTAVEAATTPSQQNGTTNSEITTQNGNIFSMALNLVGKVLLYHQPFGLRPTLSTRPNRGPAYKVSERVGCGPHGFSVSESSKKSSTSRSRRADSRTRSRASRLSPSLLRPSTSPLAEMTAQHLFLKGNDRKIITLNPGGLQFFTQKTPIEKLRSALAKTRYNNVGRDETVVAFFRQYGFAESCSMCLTIAIEDANSTITTKAVQAAINFANRPVMVPNSSGVNGTMNNATQNMISSSQFTPSSWEGTSGQNAYTFQPSSLHDGLVSLISRLLRPIWCKPAVVVTEGRVIPSKRRKEEPKILPAKVELLLDEVTLQDIRRPLVALQNLMKEVFPPAVNIVPGMKAPRDDKAIGKNGFGSDDLITQAINYQYRGPTQSNSTTQQVSEKDLNVTARLNEERSLHSLYRLISRTIQALNLMSHLRQAHATPELPEVEFGLLHGLTYSQLVTMKSAQDRIETILTHLVSRNQTATHIPNSDVESEKLSSALSRQCYLFFSVGSRLTYLGFQTAQSALIQPSSSSQRIELSKRASSFLRKAVRQWYNPSLITGRVAHETKQNSGLSTMTNGTTRNYERLAILANESGSPLSRATSILMELYDVAAVVDLCLTCASNFGGHLAESLKTDMDVSDFGDNGVNEILPWEKGLYHRPMDNASAPFDDSRSEADTRLISNRRNGGDNMNSTEAIKSDAQSTCYAILFHHLSSLLNTSSHSPQNINLIDNMVSVAIAFPDEKFHFELYDYLADSGHVDTLLRIDSAEVEFWLKENRKDHTLLWRYFVVHGLNWLAGEVMLERGCSTESISLDVRIEYLTRAVNSYRAALENSNPIENGTLSHRISTSSSSPYGRGMAQQQRPSAPSRDELRQIILQVNDRIDVAKLQSQILSTIKSSQNVSRVEEAKLETLSMTLVNVSDLYNDYAAPLALYDLCLLILQTCRYDDTPTIVTLWRSILCEELLPCSTGNREVQKFLQMFQKGSMIEEEVVYTHDTVTNDEGGALIIFEEGTWVNSLKNRIVSLGKELHGKETDYSFPLEFLVESLEAIQRTLNESSGSQPSVWALNTCIEAGATYPRLVDAYNSILASQDKSIDASSDSATRLALISSISKVIAQWVMTVCSQSSQSSAVLENRENSRMQLMQYSSVLLSQIDAYKTVLESLVGCNDNDISKSYSELSSAEEMIRRYVMN